MSSQTSKDKKTKKSDSFDQYSDGEVKKVSSCSVSEINSECTNPESYSDTMSACSACFVYSPHSQLFVCVKENCGYALQQKVPILSPSLFYRREKVFCGACAFRGVHSPHKKYMQPAEPLALKTASGEVGTKIEMSLEKFADMSAETPIDYFMIAMNGGSKTLPKIPVIDYLSSSKSIYEWHSRLPTVNQAVRTLTDCRVQSHSHVRDQAEKLLTAYSLVSKEVSEEITFKQNEELRIRESRQTEHRIRMGIHSSHKNDEDVSSISSRRSSICSVSSTNTVLQVDTKPSNFVEETVRQTNIMLSRKFDMLCRSLTAAEAALHVADLLDSRIKCINHKKEVVSYMEKTYSITWPRQLQ
ncbi:unnamed protein product [Caenorhabditis nigoni]